MKKDEFAVCIHCGAVNQLPGTKDGMEATCGKCGHALFQGLPVAVDTAMFDRQVAKSTIPVVVDIWAPWCGPCLGMAPEFEKAARAMEPAVRFLKVNSDQEQHLSQRLGIRGIPTMIVFRSGNEIARQAGAMGSGQIVSWLNAQLR
ncbi:thioredoxin TrxC [Pelagibacterium montanilacus]|uniref:thioredoxin TrxC n=1 Tax=Pelagibacterium montanilacus TaxID=2185280 RepID=UPI001FEC6769|nr:thioredoxin TrxC [Pelagibacterium montanilacus]